MSILLPALTILGALATVGWGLIIIRHTPTEPHEKYDIPEHRGGWTILVPLALTLFLGFCWWHG